MIYNLDKINEMAEGDEDFIVSVVSVFLEEVPEDLDGLEKAINNRDYENIYKLAHKIKPNVDILGMEQTRAKALEIETLGKNTGSMAEIEEKFPILKKDVLQVVAELKNDFDLYMQAEIITIGDEILIGQIVDSNSAFIAKELNKIGVSPN